HVYEETSSEPNCLHFHQICLQEIVIADHVNCDLLLYKGHSASWDLHMSIQAALQAICMKI
ncbi:mCG1037151, partial [Mus musculus]